MTRTVCFNSDKERENLVNSIESLEKTNSEMRQLIENLHVYKNNLEEELKNNKSEFADLEEELQDLKQGLSKEKKNNEILTETIRKKEIEIQFLMEKIEKIETNFTIQTQEIKLSYESAIQYLNAEIEIHKKSLIKARNTIEDCHKTYIDFKDSVKPSFKNEEEIRALEAKLSETHKDLKEKNLEIESLSQKLLYLKKENEELKLEKLTLKEEISNKEELPYLPQKFEEENEEYREKYQQVLQENEKYREKYQEIIKENEELITQIQEKENSLNRFHNQTKELQGRLNELLEANNHLNKFQNETHLRSQEKFNDYMRTNRELDQINIESKAKIDELKHQNDLYKAEVNELIKSNEKLARKIEDLAYEHQECFDKLKYEKEKAILDQKKFLQDHDFKLREFDSVIKTLENQLKNEKEANRREKEANKREKGELLREKEIYYKEIQTFELEMKQLMDLNANLKQALYSHESEINNLKTENERLLNEREKLLREFDREFNKISQNNHEYRAALVDMENTWHMRTKEQENVAVNLLRENEGLRRFADENISRGVNYVGGSVSMPFKRVVGEEVIVNNARIQKSSGFDMRTMDILNKNDRLNEQILRRCRELIGE